MMRERDEIKEDLRKYIFYFITITLQPISINSSYFHLFLLLYSALFEYQSEKEEEELHELGFDQIKRKNERKILFTLFSLSSLSQNKYIVYLNLSSFHLLFFSSIPHIYLIFHTFFIHFSSIFRHLIYDILIEDGASFFEQGDLENDEDQNEKEEEEVEQQQHEDDEEEELPDSNSSTPNNRVRSRSKVFVYFL